MRRDPIYDVDDAPMREAALVLGVGPGPLLEGRMDAACALVARRAVRRLVVSGLPREMPRMIERARSVLPADAVLVDDGAARTWESLRRARERWSIHGVLLVTQAFHLPRALFLARALGLDAAGVVAPGAASFYVAHVRERAARLRAFLDVLAPRR